MGWRAMGKNIALRVVEGIQPCRATSRKLPSGETATLPGRERVGWDGGRRRIPAACGNSPVCISGSWKRIRFAARRESGVVCIAVLWDPWNALPTSFKLPGGERG